MEHTDSCVKASALGAILRQATHGISEVRESELRPPEWVDGVAFGWGRLAKRLYRESELTLELAVLAEPEARA